jgi:hypothetical protein
MNKSTTEAIQEARDRFDTEFSKSPWSEANVWVSIDGIKGEVKTRREWIKDFIAAELSRIVALRDGEICKALEMMKNRWHWEEAYGLDKSMFYICSKCTYIQNSPEGHNCEIEDSILSQAQEIIRQLK